MIAGILIPGLRYDVQSTLLDLGWEALTDRKAHLEEVAWTGPDGLTDLDPEPFVRIHVEAALLRAGRAAPRATPVLIGKSLGTYAARLAAERELPAVWLTPLLHVEAVAAAIARNPAPQLLIGGTGDLSWNTATARATGKDVLVIDDANHALRPPGPLRVFTDALGTIGTAIEDFLDARKLTPR
ncbi:alpha/beta hydrolase [Actinoplanes sp. NPDC051346]|uniref:alpha/beta hydrolase n=1 Tax=Actinoplanes sp. NPDC051346 TaxID=3155048 RepID=UPI00341F054A